MRAEKVLEHHPVYLPPAARVRMQTTGMHVLLYTLRRIIEIVEFFLRIFLKDKLQGVRVEALPSHMPRLFLSTVHPQALRFPSFVYEIQQPISGHRYLPTDTI